jgi:hypothetical protein
MIKADRRQTSAKPIRFVYIHGTNQNTSESHQLFNQDVAQLHPYLKSALEQEPLVKAHLLGDGHQTISPQTINFFWGDLSQEDIQGLNRNLFSKQLRNRGLNLADRARKTLALALHDAVWLEKESRKKEVLHNLFRATVQESDQPIFLMGHSAGSLIVYNFLLYRLPYIDSSDFARWLQVDAEVLQTIQAQGSCNTCLEALMSSSMIRYDAEGRLVPCFDGLKSQIPESLLKSMRTEAIARLPDYTRQYCLPESMVRGVVTFGSPLALFYSTVANPKLDASYLTAKMFRYTLSHNIAWLHVNHFKDFIAVPIPDEQRMLDVILNRAGPPIELKGGFITNDVVKTRDVTLLNAHDWYWSKPAAFAGEIAKAYREGYRSWYGASGLQ